MLAIHGGKPVRKQFIPYTQHWINSDDKRAVRDAICSDRLTQGCKVIEYEETFAQYHKAKYAVSCNSGTSALMLGYRALREIGGIKGYAMSSLTYVATANAIEERYHTGVTFVDIDLKTLQASNQTNVSVEYGGYAVRDRYYSLVDACHTLGMPMPDTNIACYSTHPSKAITTGEGGMVLTNDEDVAEVCHRLCDNGRNSSGNAWRTGYNFRLSDINASLGLSQLDRLSYFITRRQDIAWQYTAAFKDNPLIVLPDWPNESCAWHLYVIMLNIQYLDCSRDDILNALNHENIGCQIHYKPIYKHPYWASQESYQSDGHPNTEYAYEQILSIPMFPKMTNGDVQDVINGIEKVLEFYKKGN